MQAEPIITPSAHRHGVDDADMLHVYNTRYDVRIAQGQQA